MNVPHLRQHVFRIIAVAVTSVLLVTGLTNCSNDKPEPGQLRSINGGKEITIPALWVDIASNTSGVEYTSVWAGHNSPTPLNVQLDDLAAKGAGSSWKAASASAAAVGTMMSGADPTDLNFNFEVSGPIDGPSAGAILTVGVLAVLKETPLKPTVTMTGTISPDGSIGTVAGIAAKMRAAADNGFETVVLPQIAATVQPTGEGDRVDTVAYGKSLGLTVVLAQNVSQAYEVFTGETLFDESIPVYSLADSPSLIEAQKTVTAAQLKAASEVVSQLNFSDELYASLQLQLSNAQSSYVSGNMDAAFAIAVDVLNQASRATAATAISSQIAKEGVAAAQATLAQNLALYIIEVDKRIQDESSKVTSMSASQSLLLPSAMTWLSYAQAVLVTLQTSVTSLDPNSPDASESLSLLAGIAQEQIAGMDVTFPQNLTMLDALPPDRVKPTESTLIHMFGYTDFLVEAGQQNENYLSGAFGVTRADLDSLGTGNLLSVVYALSDQAKKIKPEMQSEAQEVSDASTALSYYATTSLLVSSAQALGLEGVDLKSAPNIQNSELVLSSLTAGAEIVYSQASMIYAKGLQPGFANWSTAWGLEAFTTLSQSGRTGDGTVIALNEIWFDSVALYMLNALQVD